MNSPTLQMKTLVIGKQFNNTPANRDAGKLGLAEILTLTSTETGPDNESEGSEAPVYKKESGPGDLLGANYNANGGAGVVTFSVKRGDEGDELKSSLSIEVIEPDAANFTATTADNSAYSDVYAGAGFKAADSEFLPNTVSFKGLLTKEGEVEPDTDGPFDKWSDFTHEEGEWVPLDEENKDGSKDSVQSGGISKAEFEHKVKGGAGHFKWLIPWKYKVAGKSEDSFDVLQSATISDTGKVTMEKLNGREVRNAPSGPWTQSE